MAKLDTIDATKPDGATEPVAVLDDYQRELRVTVKETFAVEHTLTGEHKFYRDTTANRPAASIATNGRIYFNTTTGTVQQVVGGAWTDIGFITQRIKVGTFIGDGAANKIINGLGFSPTFVMVTPISGTNPSFVKSIYHAVGDSHKEDDMTTSVGGIDTLDADGFTIDALANVITVVYSYLAIRDLP